jgi:hypothetical protein
MLTGAPPFEGQTSQEIVEKHLTVPAPAPRSRNAAVPEWLSAVILRCMAKRPEDRYPSAAAVAHALRAGPDGAGDVDVAGAATEPLLPAALPPAAGAGTGASDDAHRRPRRGRRVSRLVGVAAVLTAVGIGTAVASRPKPAVLIENRLAEPVRISVPGNRPQALAPGDSLRITVARGEAFHAEWSLVRPIDAAGRPMGEALGGRLRADGVRGDVRRYIELGTLDTPYFAPVIENRAGVPLHVRVLAGPADAAGCDCAIPAHAARAHLGYYPLAPQSAVVVRDDAGRSIRFAGFSASAPAENGLVPLVVEAEGLRAAAEPEGTRVAAPLHRRLAPAEEPETAAVAPRADSTPRVDSAPPRPRRAADPLRGIFPHP